MSFARAVNIDPPLPCSSRALDSADKRWIPSLALLAGALVIGTAMQVFGPRWVRSLVEVVQLNSIGSASALLLALVTAMVLHEVGHLVAAVFFDFEILGGSFGPVRAVHLHGKWTAQFCSTRGFNGSISAIPRDNRAWRNRMLVVIAAGPAMTLLTGIAAATVLVLANANGWAAAFLGALTQFSFFIFVLGLIPNAATAKAKNDARLFSSVWRNGEEAEEIRLYHAVAQLSAAGVRPRDYPDAIIRKLAGARGRPEAGLLFASTIAMWAMDRGDIETADAWDERSLELSRLCDAAFENTALAKSACFDALFRDDLATAREKFRGVNFDRLTPECFKHRAKAAHSIAEGSFAEALAEVRWAERSFPKELPYYEFERMLMGMLVNKAAAGLNT